MHTRRDLLSTLFIVSAGTACPPITPESRRKIGVVPKSTTRPFWRAVHAGVIQAGQDEDVGIDWNGPADSTAFSEQIGIVEAMISAGVDGIVIAPINSAFLADPVERAYDANIPVTIFDSGIDTDKYVSFVATNNRSAGVSAAEKLAEILGGQGKIGVVKGFPGNAATTEREQGFEETLKTEFPDMSIVAVRYSASNRARALRVSLDMLKENSDLDGMFASAEPATFAVVSAVKSLGLAGKVKLLGFDTYRGIQDDLRDGTISALVLQDPFNIGYTAVKTITSTETPEKIIESPIQLVTAANLSRMDVMRLLNPRLD